MDKLFPVFITFCILVLSCFFEIDLINSFAASICVFLLIKWITDYRKCTFSYIECKLIRGVPKEEGIIYNFTEPLFDINKRKDRYLIYFIVIIILFINRKYRDGCYFSYKL